MMVMITIPGETKVVTINRASLCFSGAVALAMLVGDQCWWCRIV